MTLQLEYICTEADNKEAQSLNLQRQFGGGPRWRSRLLLWVFIAIGAGLVYLRCKMEIAPKDRWWFIVLCVVVFIVMQFFQRLARQKKNLQPVRLEISEQELVLQGGNGRTAMAWTAFSRCLESSTLFVLLNQTKTLLWVVPKRAFPDEKSQDWFRGLTARLESKVEPPAAEISSPARFAAKGITLTLQPGYRDFVVRMITSWRYKGIVLAVLMLVFGIFLFTPSPPHPVNSRGKTILIMLAVMVPMFSVMFFVVSLVSWHSEKKLWRRQQLALSDEGIQFASDGASGLLAWKTYQYYLENRWAFFIWNPRGSLWLMFPKRQFSSPLEIDQCRDLLRMNLKPSRWFYF